MIRREHLNTKVLSFPTLLKITKIKYIISGKIITSFLESIETKGLMESDADQLLKKTYNLMQAEYSKINAELRVTEYSSEN
jgi:hypothetical protein